METEEQERIEAEQLQSLALEAMEGIAAGLLIAGEHLTHLLHESGDEGAAHKLAMSSALACFSTFAGREVMRCIYTFN